MTNVLSKIKDNLKLPIILILAILLLAIDATAKQSPHLETMTLDEKIGQLIVIPACQLRGDDHFEDLKGLIQQGMAGGILLKQGTAEEQRKFIERLQMLSEIPLFCIQDGEWGVAMRLTDVISFPRNLTLGAVQDLDLIYALGQEIGRQCNYVGAHINLAPVIDVNCNPQNPIIHMRSFGEDPSQVAERGLRIMQGIQSKGVIACAKHFPGHGDTKTDSHVDLPMITHSKERLNAIELYPFKALIKDGVQAVMTAHLYIETLAEDALLPATFSKRIVTDLLKTELGFDGLIISDALNMKALANHFSADQIALKAILAGHDLLLYGDHIAPNIDQILHSDVPMAIKAVKTAVENGQISEALIDEKVGKILSEKKRLGLFETKFPLESEEINSLAALELKKKLFEEAITVVDDVGILPLNTNKIALIEWGPSPFFRTLLEKECDIDVFSLEDIDLVLKLQRYSSFVVSLSNVSNTFPEFGIGQNEQSQLAALSSCGVAGAAVVFGTPYSIARIPAFNAMVIAYEKDPDAQEAAAKVVLGQIPAKGRLPVSACDP